MSSPSEQLSRAHPRHPEVHEFAERVFQKCNRRQRRVGFHDFNWPDAVRDLLLKEGWRRDTVGKLTP